MAELTPEDLKKMTPEQLAELQIKQCIFCHIIKGQVSAKKVYEDDKVIAILDINPANPGHTLLIPKQHYAIMPQMPDDIIKHMFIVAKKISHTLLSTFKASGTNIFVANGVVAGQKAPHFILHIIPRKEGDNAGLELPGNDIPGREMKKLYEHLYKRFAQKYPNNVIKYQVQFDVDDTEKQDTLQKEAAEKKEIDDRERSNESHKREKIAEDAPPKKKTDNESASLDDIAAMLAGGKK